MNKSTLGILACISLLLVGTTVEPSVSSAEERKSSSVRISKKQAERQSAETEARAILKRLEHLLAKDGSLHEVRKRSMQKCAAQMRPQAETAARLQQRAEKLPRQYRHLQGVKQAAEYAVGCFTCAASSYDFCAAARQEVSDSVLEIERGQSNKAPAQY